MSPSTRREWIEINFSCSMQDLELSPSTRREWIEMTATKQFARFVNVSLHTEGVD